MDFSFKTLGCLFIKATLLHFLYCNCRFVVLSLIYLSITATPKNLIVEYFQIFGIKIRIRWWRYELFYFEVVVIKVPELLIKVPEAKLSQKSVSLSTVVSLDLLCKFLTSKPLPRSGFKESPLLSKLFSPFLVVEGLVGIVRLIE